MQLALPLKTTVDSKFYGVAVLILAGLAFTPTSSLQSSIESISLNLGGNSREKSIQIETKNKDEGLVALRTLEIDNLVSNGSIVTPQSEPVPETVQSSPQTTTPADIAMVNTDSRSASVEPSAESQSLSGKVISLAMSWEGVPYLYGGKSRSGVDCSALVQIVFQQIGIELPRTSYEQFRMGIGVPKANLLPGDLVFFSTSGSGASHVGIYIGDGNFISATRHNVEVQSLESTYWENSYRGSRRVIS